MKKLFAMLLALCLLCGAAALAENTTVTENGKSGSTKVSYQVATCGDFIVTIPASVTLAGTTESADVTGALDIELNGENVNVDGFEVTVTLEESANGFKLKNGANEAAYGVKMADAEIAAGAKVLTWTFDPAVTVKTARATLSLSAASADFKVAGEYTDILTFKVSTNSTTITVEPDPDWGGDIDFNF